LDQRVDEGEVLAGVEEGSGKRPRHTLPEESVKSGSGDLERRLQPRRDGHAHDGLSALAQLAREEGKVVVSGVLNQIHEREAT
jgi:hypothetical protein